MPLRRALARTFLPLNSWALTLAGISVATVVVAYQRQQLSASHVQLMYVVTELVGRVGVLGVTW